MRLNVSKLILLSVCFAFILIIFTANVFAAAPSAPDLAPESDTGISDTDNITKDTTPTFIGTAAAGSQIRIYINEDLASTVSANDSGVWSYTPGFLADGLIS